MKTRENDRCPISCVRGARGREESCRRTRFFFLSFFFSFFFFLFHFDSSTRNLRRFYRSPRIFTIIAIVCKMTLHLSMQELARQIFVAFRGFLSKKKKKKKLPAIATSQSKNINVADFRDSVFRISVRITGNRNFRKRDAKRYWLGRRSPLIGRDHSWAEKLNRESKMVARTHARTHGSLCR